MSMQQFCLRWNNHQPNFISVFSSLLNNETLVDVTLAAEGHHLQAHKVVLSACSTYFQSLFTVNPCQHPIVILKDVKFSDLKIMVDFMYYGEVNVSQEQLPSIMKTAESLKIKGLAEMQTASSQPKWPSETSGVERGDSCSPSPSPLSPSFRRKRLRKGSIGSTSGGSADKTEELSEITLVPTNIVKPEPHIVSQETGENLRRPINTTTDTQGSIDEDQISIMSNMESSTTTTPAQSEGSLQEVGHQSGGSIGHSSLSSHPPTHQGLQWTIMEHTYPRFALSSCQTNLSVQASSAFTTPDITASSSSISEHQYQSGGGSSTPTAASSCALNNYPNSSSHGSMQQQQQQQHGSSGSGGNGTASGNTSGNGQTAGSGPSPGPTQCPSNCQSPCASPQATIKRKRSTNPQADENFIRALEAVRYGGIGFCKAARMFGVNNRTLWLEYKKRGYPNNRPSLKSRVKQEANSSPPPAPPASSSQSVNSQSPTPMGPPTTPHSTHNTHPTHTMLTAHSPHTMLSGYIDSRHTDYNLPSSMPINLHGVNYNSIHRKSQLKQAGTKHGRFLMRQPRVKKETEPGQRGSPESEPGSPRIVLSSSSQHQVGPSVKLPLSREASWEESSEAPGGGCSSSSIQSSGNASTNLLTVPQPSYLVKQHSHPLLPSQQTSASGNYWIQRQHSNPECPGRTSSPTRANDPIPLIKIDEGGTQNSDAATKTAAALLTSPRDSSSSLLPSNAPGGIRLVPAELLRSSSAPQTSTSGVSETRGVLPREGSSDQRGHCPVQRPGPALGCNHCWNTIGTNGRMLRRKTKYHCPECQINLCIVPCFQEFHERPREMSTLRPLPKTSSI